MIAILANSIYAQNLSFEEMKNLLSPNSLPLVNLTVNLSLMNNKDFLDAEIEIADYQRRTYLTLQNVHYLCKLRYRGASALKYEKKSFAVKLFNINGNDLDGEIFGIRNENDWILDAMAIDRIRMRNWVCFDLWNQMSRTPYETDYDGRKIANNDTHQLPKGIYIRDGKTIFVRRMINKCDFILRLNFINTSASLQ